MDTEAQIQLATEQVLKALKSVLYDTDDTNSLMGELTVHMVARIMLSSAMILLFPQVQGIKEILALREVCHQAIDDVTLLSLCFKMGGNQND